jgi:hypothetical protein
MTLQIEEQPCHLPAYSYTDLAEHAQPIHDDDQESHQH